MKIKELSQKLENRMLGFAGIKCHYAEGLG